MSYYIDDDMYGYPEIADHVEEIQQMFSPVRCTCGTIYDLGAVEVTARYVDCSMWRAPCCGRTADDRGETGWKSTRDYYPIDKQTGREK